MTTLHQGDRGPAVLELQTLLLMTGNDPGPLDGIFGPKTLAGVRAFQAWSHGVSESGGAAALGAWGDQIDGTDLDALRALPRRGVELPRILTPVSLAAMRAALLAGWHEVFGPVPEDQSWLGSIGDRDRAVRVALAQLCVEHGCEPWGVRLFDDLARHGHAPASWLAPPIGETAFHFVWNNNVGNRQVAAKDRSRHSSTRGPIDSLVPWFPLRAAEGHDDSARLIISACYAFPNATEGAAGYWRFLRDNCAPALRAFEVGNVTAAARELKVGAWHYSGDEAAYTRAMVDRFRWMA